MALLDYEIEIRWQQSVLRESELKKNRYPWNLAQLSESLESNSSFANPHINQLHYPVLPHKTPSRNLSIHSIKSENQQKELSPPSNLSNDSTDLDARESRIKPFQPSTRGLSLAIDNFLSGIGSIENELKELKQATGIKPAHNKFN
jgi:hypothetical protein